MPGRDHVETTTDRLLNGRLLIEQPAAGHRAGLDAILLAAACPAMPGERIADLGAGVGTAGLAVLARVPDTHATLVERNPALSLLSQDNATQNGIEGRVQVLCAEIGAPGGAAAAGLPQGSIDHVIANPPFRENGQPSPDPLRAEAHMMGDEGLEAWFRWASGLLRAGGSITLIHDPAALPDLIALATGRFGGMAVKPIHPVEDKPSRRVLFQAMRGSRAPLRICPPLVLHESEGGPYTTRADGILRNSDPVPIC